MILALLSLLAAILIGLGRQSAALGKLEVSLWFFSNFEKKRIIFTIIAFVCGTSSYLISEKSLGLIIVLITALFLVLFSFFFDMTYFFPEIKTVEKKKGSQLNLEGKTKIMGVQINDIPMAYPFDIVMTRHIINDKVDSKGVLVSFCAICRSGLIFSSEVDGEILYFKVSGIWRRNMIMVDTKTQSLWQQATGECIYGTHKGKHLELLSGENTNWESWIAKHPKSLFAIKCIEARKGLLSRAAMMKGLEFATTRITPPGFTKLNGLPSRETVFGLDYNGIAKAYPKSELQNVSEFSDEFGSSKIQLKYNATSDYLTAIDSKSNKQLVIEKHWWIGWKEFHPTTLIWANNL